MAGCVHKTGTTLSSSSESSEPPAPAGLIRMSVEKPQPAVDFLHQHGAGVMDLIAHFWEQLPQTPPLARQDLHLLIASPYHDISKFSYEDLLTFGVADISGAMLYVPKAHRADVLAMDSQTAERFANYIARHGVTQDDQGNTIAAIDFISGAAHGVLAMVPFLLPLVHKRTPAKQLVNTVMQLSPDVKPQYDPAVRPARDEDLPVLNRWRRQYKEERGILFDADISAMIAMQRVFVYEVENQVVAVSKIDIEINHIAEIGGVFTFPEFRNRGYGRKIVDDIAARIVQKDKIPVLQVDRENLPACHLYERAGWRQMGELARVWLTAS